MFFVVVVLLLVRFCVCLFVCLLSLLIFLKIYLFELSSFNDLEVLIVEGDAET